LRSSERSLRPSGDARDVVAVRLDEIERLRARLRRERRKVVAPRAVVVVGQRERIAVNPVRKVKLSRPKSRPVRPLPPATIEALSARLAARDAIVVSILAYAGLRPHELRGLRWRDITSALRVNAGKAGERVVRLLAPLAADLAEWQLACGRPAEFEFVVPSERETVQAEHIGRRTANGSEGWRQRVFVPNMQALGLDGTRTYELRHAFASLLAHEGRSVVYIAKQLGHGADVSLKAYQHVIDELDDRPALAAEDAIREAREERKALRRQS
jgi:integrase